MSQRKALQTRLKEVTNEIEGLKDSIKASQRRLSQLETEQKKLVLELAPSQKHSIGVSDHAILRYLENKFNLDIDSIRAEILTPDRISAIKSGASRITAGGVSFVVQNNTIVTAIGKR